MYRNESQTPSFADVQRILDRLVDGRWDFLQVIHGPGFGWQNKQQLAQAVVQPGGTKQYRLIDPQLVKEKRGQETNLIKALTTGVDHFSRMPKDGPYATDEELRTIIDWINAGMPD